MTADRAIVAGGLAHRRRRCLMTTCDVPLWFIFALPLAIAIGVYIGTNFDDWLDGLKWLIKGVWAEAGEMAKRKRR